MSYHEPVLAAEAIAGLAIAPGGIYVDATFGGGGHARLILEQLGPAGRLIAFDQDADAEANLPKDDRLLFVPHNFRYLKRFLRLHGVSAVDGILADLGVSSHQFDEGARGFSFRFDSALDMRMDQREEKTAARIVNTYDASALQDVFSRFGEVRNAKSLAMAIEEARTHREIRTIADFLAILEPLIRGQRARYLAQVFQALRIEVNDEMGALQDFLEQSLTVLHPGGRLVVISYHSLEDRMVKQFMKTGDIQGALEQDFYGHIHRPFRLITKKAMEPGAEEQHRNPRSRSARLRIAEKKRTEEA